ncbi:MAG: hypothetical protein ACUZ9M_06090 [Candidatus Scalindua sp.]
MSYYFTDDEINSFITEEKTHTGTIHDIMNFKLRRHNGKSHEHSNKLEGVKFYDFHIHFATQRYQDEGRKEESYAEVTDRYSDIKEALNCLLEDCNIS